MKPRRTTRGKSGVRRTAAARSGERGLDLSSLFGVAAQALAANQTSLNQADTVNQNHGDNMVQAFNMITQALGSAQGGTPSQQLNHASQYLAQNGNSGSAHLYSQGLAQAAQQLQGQQTVNPNNAGALIQALLGGEPAVQQQAGAEGLLTSLLGGGQPQAGGGAGDLLGSLLGGGQQQTSGGTGDLLGSLLGGGQQQTSSGAGDLLGSLLGGGQPQPTQNQDSGLDIGDVINAGLAFMNAKQQGQGNLQAALTAIMATGPMGQRPYRQQSGQLVANALLQAVAGMSRR